MTIMHDPIQQLVDDHINISIVHRHLRSQMGAFQESVNAENLGLLMDITDYLKNYPECQHHAIEDRIYNIMRLRITNKPLIRLLDTIEVQHSHLRILSQRFQSGLQAIANDQVVSKDIIVADYNDYLSLYEDHIHNENSHLLPIIENYLTEDELACIGEEMLATQDPLFSARKAEAYINLFAQITQEQLPAW